VRAEDLPAFIDSGFIATPAMREVRFAFADRMVLAPMEIVGGLKYLLIIAVIFFFLSGLNRSGYAFQNLMDSGLSNVIALAIIYIASTVLGPALLPWLPGRAFSLKGIWIGLVFGFLLMQINRLNPVDAAGWGLIAASLSSFILMNFTGSSTFTSLSGVKREMRYAIPLQVIGAVTGLGLWVAGRFI
jgi:acetyl-CoA decarbonylase/synthase complex subunit gamma